MPSTVFAHIGLPKTGTTYLQDRLTGNAADALLTCLKCFQPEATSIGGGPCATSNVISEIIA